VSLKNQVWQIDGELHARCSLCARDVGFLLRGDFVPALVRTVEIGRSTSMLENILLIVICALLFGYLMVALLKPEKF
jgi:K+-transporting ATPase KdpF subunit